MKSLLLYSDRDFDTGRKMPPNAAILTQDLELGTLLHAMTGDDEFLLGVARPVLLAGLADPRQIIYRQEILDDCIRNPEIVTGLYAIAESAIRAENKVYRGIFSGSGYVLHRSIEVLQLYVGVLRQLRQVADEQGAGFTSPGFTRFFAMLRSQLDDGYFSAVEDHLRRLRFRSGVTISGQLGRGNVGAGYVLRRPADARPSLMSRLSGQGRPGFVLTVAARDESGLQTLSGLSDRGIDLVANALAQSTDHILSFLTMIRWELGFYVGCLHLHDALTHQGGATCFPVPVAAGKQALSGHGLYDPCLSLRLDGQAVGNAVTADGTPLMIITGANQGGKSTFLRSVGLAHLMMQCGMFVAAESFTADITTGVFTHYKREEDATMASGKLDEELSRMTEILDHIRPGGLLLCNESFASTNEREGSQIARSITRALVDSGVRVLFVTHFFDLADGFYREDAGRTLFLRAERRDDGQRTFRLVAGRPLPTSHARDVYEGIFSQPAASR